MDESLIEDVAFSVVRDFLIRKGLRKTRQVLEEEYPGSLENINNRNELRSILHMDKLFQENKLAKTQLETVLELMTKYFLEDFGQNKLLTMARDQNEDASKKLRRGLHWSASTLSFLDLCDSEAGESTAVSDISRSQIHRSETSMTRPPNGKCKTTDNGPRNSSSTTDTKVRNSKEVSMGKSAKPESPAETKSSTSEAQRPKTSKIVRGMMSGPIASFREVCSFFRRLLKRSKR